MGLRVAFYFSNLKRETRFLSEAKGSYFKMTTKEQFLSEHNRLSPLNLQATMALLSRFRIDKASLFKNDDWSIDKLRRPFISWLTSLPSGEKEKIKKEKI